jgi:hypothetical protein
LFSNLCQLRANLHRSNLVILSKKRRGHAVPRVRRPYMYRDAG